LNINTAVPIDTIFQWDGLGVFDKGCFAFDQTCVVRIDDFFGTLFSAGPAGDAQRLVNISRVPNQLDLKVACAAFNSFYFTERFELDI